MVRVYISCRMTGRDKAEQVRRAKYVCSILRQYGIDPISPVLAENVENKPGPLINDNYERLKGFWARDKQILRYESHVMLFDQAQDKSFGCERELGLQRYCLWKPIVLLMPDMGLTVASIEDDAIVHNVHDAGRIIRERWGTWDKRVMWRIKMLYRTLPTWIKGQVYAWL